MNTMFLLEPRLLARTRKPSEPGGNQAASPSLIVEMGRVWHRRRQVNEETWSLPSDISLNEVMIQVCTSYEMYHTYLITYSPALVSGRRSSNAGKGVVPVTAGSSVHPCPRSALLESTTCKSSRELPGVTSGESANTLWDQVRYSASWTRLDFPGRR
jgi:hypothetical protein